MPRSRHTTPAGDLIPSIPAPHHPRSPSGPCHASAGVGDIACFGDGSLLRASDIPVPAAPVDLGRIETKGEVRGIAVAGGHAFAAEGEGGMAVYRCRMESGSLRATRRMVLLK